MKEITLQVEPDPRAPRVSRHSLSEIKPALEPRFDDVAVIISELVTNSVRYGSGSSEIEVLVATTEKSIRVEVSDGGPCFDPDLPRDDGLGLDIVDKIAESWGVERTPNCKVWVEIRRA